MPKVYTNFNFTEAKIILSIPHVCDNVDRRIGHFTKSGRYTVKSGYYAALEYLKLADPVAGSGSNSSPS